MKTASACLMMAILCVAGSGAQQSSTPQTARQALMEMFFGKAPGTFAKHLPAATRAALDKSGVLAQLQQYSAMASQMHAQGQNLQTFETGPVMLSTEDPKTGQKVEVTVVSDAVHGDREDIELSSQVYKKGQAERTPFMPQVTFSMKQEAQVWTLNEISLTIHLPLADPDLLKAFTEKMKPQPAVTLSSQNALGQTSTTHVTFTSQSDGPMAAAGSDAMIIGAMRSILTAEVTYARTYPTVGFTCTLSDLDGFGSSERNERQAMLINSGLASGKRYGYAFTLSECAGTPATAFHLTAAPNGNSYGRKTFCADQTGAIRSSDDGNPATCTTSGTPVQ
jgi:hypothetical protein